MNGLDELIAFLRARYDEAEQDVIDGEPVGPPERRLADLAGKRKIIDMAEAQPGWEPADGRSDRERHWDEAAQVMMVQVLQHLAEEFAGHPGYKTRDWGPLGSGNPVPE